MSYVWVLDSASLIRFKRIPAREQWDFFKRLEQMVIDGEIALARQVIREVSEIAFPDMPGAWARGVEKQVVHPLEPDYDVLEEVMTQAGDVVEVDDPGDPADPYVLAIALQLEREGHDVVVVSDDVVDRAPLKTSVQTACKRLHISHCTANEFLRDIDGPTLSG